eukprot:CAMPEP_0194284152 /NCGR_PEP_ID=MMETSP0169-20130528/26890_1 /TAXON_ID=218684 /ORGANISM="Corethron pennatum, Strain L29A3" /LENGTH=323 /DNA_ID=CAMNT_0039029893 /DNA_START=163 /DNA_END=1134 /DNA_ORIENTATION=-
MYATTCRSGGSSNSDLAVAGRERKGPHLRVKQPPVVALPTQRVHLVPDERRRPSPVDRGHVQDPRHVPRRRRDLRPRHVLEGPAGRDHGEVPDHARVGGVDLLRPPVPVGDVPRPAQHLDVGGGQVVDADAVHEHEFGVRRRRARGTFSEITRRGDDAHLAPSAGHVRDRHGRPPRALSRARDPFDAPQHPGDAVVAVAEPGPDGVDTRVSGEGAGERESLVHVRGGQAEGGVHGPSEGRAHAGREGRQVGRVADVPFPGGGGGGAAVPDIVDDLLQAFQRAGREDSAVAVVCVVQGGRQVNERFGREAQHGSQGEAVEGPED